MAMRAALPRILLPLVRTRAFSGKLQYFIRLRDGRYVVKLNRGRTCVVLDADFQEVRVWKLPRSWKPGHALAVAEDLLRFALAFDQQVEVFDIDGKLLHRQAFPAKGRYLSPIVCHFTRDGAGLWVIRATEENDFLVYWDVESGEVRAELPLDNCDSYYAIHAHPTDDAILIDAGKGQEGSFQWVARTKPRFEVTLLSGTDRVFGGFSRTGEEYVTAPQWGAKVMIHQFPSGKTLRSTPPASELFGWAQPQFRGESEEDFDLYAYYLTERRVLALTYPTARHLLLDASDLRVIAELWPAGFELIAYNHQGRPAKAGQAVDHVTGNLRCDQAGPNNTLMRVQEDKITLWDLGDL